MVPTVAVWCKLEWVEKLNDAESMFAAFKKGVDSAVGAIAHICGSAPARGSTDNQTIRSPQSLLNPPALSTNVPVRGWVRGFEASPK